MPETPHRLNGFRLTVDGTALSFDYGWQRDQSWRLTFFDAVENQAKSITGATINFQIVDMPGGTTLESGTLTITNGDEGEATLAIEDTDFPSLSFYSGQINKTFYLYIQVSLSGEDQAVFDDLGNLSFPFRVWWEPA